MKTISKLEFEAIRDVASEGASLLSEGIFEKDLLVAEILKVVSDSSCFDILPVFCGGTCLSQAYRLIQRMSEDIDFKLIVPEGLSRNARSKKLKSLKHQLVANLVEAGFYVPADEIRARNENSFIAMNIYYKSCFAPVASLRPEIKLELTARAPRLPTRSRTITTLLEEMVPFNREAICLDCISVEETLVEKLVSFLRRTAEHRAGYSRGSYDNRLVRHLYDVYAIASVDPALLDDTLLEHFAVLVHEDARQFENQFPLFVEDPCGQMRLALSALELDHTFEKEYQALLQELVFGAQVPFGEARRLFASMAESGLAYLERRA